LVLTRGPAADGQVFWDGERLGPWTREIDGSDVVINLAGRSVSCRYTKGNLTQMMRSRVNSARVVGQAIAAAGRPPRTWLQMSTATIYAHTHGAPNDDVTGVIGGWEEGVPGYWAFSVDIARAWERELDEAQVPATRKVALRAAMVMTPDRGGVFDVLSRMARLGLGGTVGGGEQYVSWIHEDDFTAAVRFIIDQDVLTGPVNLASPGPVRQRDFMRALRAAWAVPIGLPATRWMAELGALAIRTDTELLLKSRRVVPAMLTTAGFEFQHGTWPEAARDLARRARARDAAGAG
jgi:uncharacterized protein (TIGR01777 family)